MTGLPYFRIYFFTYNSYSIESEMLGKYLESLQKTGFFNKNYILRHKFSKSMHVAVSKKGLTGERALRTERMTSIFIHSCR
jgi:hypothetical protein